MANYIDTTSDLQKDYSAGIFALPSDELADSAQVYSDDISEGIGTPKFTHNLYETLGMTLLEGIESGRLDPRSLEYLSANIGLDLGRGYGANLGYNEYIGHRRQDLKLQITKDF